MVSIRGPRTRAAQEHGDADIANLFTQASGDLDKHLWFLEAHLQA